MTRKTFDLPSLPNEPPECRVALAVDPKSPPAVLEILSHDRFWFVRDRVASNISTPRACLLRLLQDTDFRVRMEAERTLQIQAEAAQKRQPAGEKTPLAQRVAEAGSRVPEQTNSSGPSLIHNLCITNK